MTQQKTKRKNNGKTAVIAVLLFSLIAILCFGGYTLSKYVTSSSDKGVAQVAKWGYTLEADGSNLFGKNYKFDRKHRALIREVFDRFAGIGLPDRNQRVGVHQAIMRQPVCNESKRQ